MEGGASLEAGIKKKRGVAFVGVSGCERLRDFLPSCFRDRLFFPHASAWGPNSCEGAAITGPNDRQRQRGD